MFQEADDDTQREQYEKLCALLEGAGYGQYELSNFSRPRRECLHNRLYWYCEDYIGCGPSAHSHWQGKRWANARTLNDYFTSLNKRGHARVDEECLDAPSRAREALVIGLRQTHGIRLDRFHRRTGLDAMDLAGPAITQMIQQGWLQQTNDRLKLSAKARFVSDSLFAELV